MGLPVITRASPKEINEFYKKLLLDVQSLVTIGKLREVCRKMRAVLDKLEGIKGDLVRGHTGWHGKTGILANLPKQSSVGEIQIQQENRVIERVCSRERMIATIGMHAAHTEDLIRSSNKEVKDRCVGASIVMRWITYPLIVPMLLQLEIEDRF